MLPDLTVLIALLLGLGAVEGAMPGSDAPLLVIGGSALAVASAVVAIRAAAGRGVAAVRANDIAVAGTIRRWLPMWALAAWAACLFLFGWGGFVGEHVPRVLWVVRLAVLFLPAALPFLAAWRAQGDIDQAIFRDRASMPPAVARPVLGAVRRNGIALFPMLFFLSLTEGLWVLGALGVKPLAEAMRWVEAMPLLTLVTVMGMVLLTLPFIPWAFAKLLKTYSLPEGHLRTLLERSSARIDLTYKDIVVWPTPMPNAMVVGFTPGTRRIFLTEGIVRALPEDELLAVFFHEAGHAKKHHLPLLLTLFFSVGLIFHALQMPAVGIGIPPLLLFAAQLAVLWYGILGFVSRHFEREADLYGAEHASILEPDAAPVDLGDGPPVPRGAALMARALDRVRDISGNEKSHRHGSINDRIEYVVEHATQPAVRESFTKTRRQMLIGTAALAVIGILASVRIYPAELAHAKATLAIEEGAEAYATAFGIDYRRKPGESRPLWESAYNSFIRASAFVDGRDDVESQSIRVTALWNAGDAAMHGLIDAERARPHFEALQTLLAEADDLAGIEADRLRFQVEIELGRIAAWTGEPEADARRHLQSAGSNRLVRGGSDVEPDADSRRYYGARRRLLELTIEARYGGVTAPMALPKLRELTTSASPASRWLELRFDAAREIERLTRMLAPPDDDAGEAEGED